MTEFIEVTEQEFMDFLKNYPRVTRYNVAHMYEPPLHTFNDLERAPYWPESVVAKFADFTDGKCFEVLKDIDAPVVSDSKPDLEPLYDMNGVEVKIGDTVEEEGAYIATVGYEKPHRFTVIKRDIGTVYERWTPHDCWNNLRGDDFWKVEVEK
jgi:hypothetical protein